MIKLLKYELKDISRTVVTALLIVFVLNTLVFVGHEFIGGGFSAGIDVKQTEGGFGFKADGILAIGIIICYLVDISMLIMAFILGINIFRKDLYNDSGVMLLTLPRTGMQIVAAKFLTAILQFVIIFLVSSFFLVLHTIGLSKSVVDVAGRSFFNILYYVTIEKFDLWVFATIIVLAIFSWITAAAYLAIAFSKGLLKKKKLRWLVTIAVFIGAVALDSFFGGMLEKVIPHTYDATSILVMSRKTIEDGLQLNTASSIFELLVMGAMLVGTAYLVEKKVEI